LFQPFRFVSGGRGVRIRPRAPDRSPSETSAGPSKGVPERRRLAPTRHRAPAAPSRHERTRGRVPRPRCPISARPVHSVSVYVLSNLANLLHLVRILFMHTTPFHYLFIIYLYRLDQVGLMDQLEESIAYKVQHGPRGTSVSNLKSNKGESWSLSLATFRLKIPEPTPLL
jgi:hypothetical protein